MGETGWCSLGTVTGRKGSSGESALIRLLADGRFHSGEELGACLGISRAAIWKRLEELEALGLTLERVRGKGYRLPGGLSLLDAGAIVRASGLEPGSLDLVVLESTDSTNAEALRRTETGLISPLAVLAEHQQAGRGRRGRAWQSPFGSNLYLTLAREFTSAARLEGLSLAVGVAVAEVLENTGLAGRVQLKWPNDIQCNGRKLGGVLVELAGDLDASCMAVIGIGLNGAMPAAVAEGIDQPWTDLRGETGAPLERNLLAGQLLGHLMQVLELFAERGFAGLRKRWERYDCCIDRPVRVELAGRQVQGIARGVDARGALLVEHDGQVQAWHGGEVSLRLA